MFSLISKPCDNFVWEVSTYMFWQRCICMVSSSIHYRLLRINMIFLFIRAISNTELEFINFMQPLKITNSPPLFITRFSLYLTKNHSWSTCGRREWKYKFNYFIIILYRNGMLDFSNVHVRIYNTCHAMIIMWGLLWIMRCTYTIYISSSTESWIMFISMLEKYCRLLWIFDACENTSGGDL